MPSSQYLYVLAEDLYRLGNATTPRLENVRTQDVDLYELNQVQMVRSNGKGISLLTETRLGRVRASGWLWKIAKDLPLVEGLAISPDPNPAVSDHFLLCPKQDMSLAEYCALLSEMGLRCERVRKL